MTRNVLLLAGALCCGCANLIGLNDLGSTGEDGTTGGGSNDEGTGAEPGAGGSETGGEPGNGGTTGDGGQTSGGGTDTGGTDSGGAGSGGTETGGTDSGGGGGGGGGSGGVAGVGGQPYECTDDMFHSEQTTEDCWQVFNPSLLLGGGDRGYTYAYELLTMVPTVGRGWLDGDSAFFMYQVVDGNFLIEVNGSIETYPSSFNPPEISRAYAGLLAIPLAEPLSEEPNATHDNYYALKVGTFDTPAVMGTRAEYTTGEVTTREDLIDSEIWETFILRLCRVGNTLSTAVRRHDASVWTPLHPDGDTTGFALPSGTGPLRVGMIAEVSGGAGTGTANIVYRDSQFETIPPDSLDDCF